MISRETLISLPNEEMFSKTALRRWGKPLFSPKAGQEILLAGDYPVHTQETLLDADTHLYHDSTPVK